MFIGGLILKPIYIVAVAIYKQLSARGAVMRDSHAGMCTIPGTRRTCGTGNTLIDANDTIIDNIRIFSYDYDNV